MKIEVQDADIMQRGRSGWNCPIARAIQRATSKPEVDVFVSYDWVEIDYGAGRLMTTERTALPASACRWQRAYDRSGCTGKPFAFDLGLEVAC